MRGACKHSAIVADDGPDLPTPWLRSRWGELSQVVKGKIESGQWLDDAVIMYGMRLLAGKPPNARAPVGLIQDTITCTNGFASAGDHTIQPMFSSHHWGLSTNIYTSDRPVVIESLHDSLPDAFVHFLKQLYPTSRTYIRINCYKQPESFSCGYRVLAFAWHVAMRTPLEKMAKLHFSLRDLQMWVLRCLQNETWVEPPVCAVTADAKRANSVNIKGAIGPLQTRGNFTTSYSVILR